MQYSDCMIQLVQKYITFVVILLLLVGCNLTRQVKDGEYLLDKIEIETNTSEIPKSEANTYVKQKPNDKILGLFRFHLWLYSLSGKNEHKGFRGKVSNWLRKIGEPPVIYDAYQIELSRNEVRTFMINKGFVNASVSDSTIFNEKRKRAEVVINIHPDKPYLIENSYYDIKDPFVESLIMADTANSLVKSGKRFDMTQLDKERDRIVKLLKQNGYYEFSKDYIYYVADSSQNQRRVTDTIKVSDYTVVMPDGSINTSLHKQYYIRNVFVLPNYDPQTAIQNPDEYFGHLDTVEYQRVKYLYYGEPNFTPQSLNRNNYIFPDNLYDYRDAERTHIQLSSIAAIQYVNIRFLINEMGADSLPTLDCYIQITPNKYKSMSIDLEGTSQNGGNLGAGINLTYQHRNVFKGAETWNSQIRWARESQVALSDRKFYNSNEVGVQTSLLVPKFMFPVFTQNRFFRNIKATTNFELAYNFQKRPDYTRIISNVGVRYNWRKGKYKTFGFDVLDFNYVKIDNITDIFKNYIDTTFLKYSYEDHVIHNVKFVYSYNNQESGNQSSSNFVRLSAETGGNVLSAMSSLLGLPKENDSYKFLGVKFSQYAKFDFTTIYKQQLTLRNTLVYRFFAGIGIPYGNQSVLPFEKRYFSGGTSGVRAWQVRTLGPGVFYNNKMNYMNQSGDIKIEGNIEYRFKLFWVMEGALFADAGNVWVLNKNEDQPGGEFLYNKFYKQIALGYGPGLRFDFNFFVARLDLGIKAYNPVLSDGHRWIGSPDIKSDMVLNLGIGYPF